MYTLLCSLRTLTKSTHAPAIELYENTATVHPRFVGVDPFVVDAMHTVRTTIDNMKRHLGTYTAIAETPSFLHNTTPDANANLLASVRFADGVLPSWVAAHANNMIVVTEPRKVEEEEADDAIDVIVTSFAAPEELLDLCVHLVATRVRNVGKVFIVSARPPSERVLAFPGVQVTWVSNVWW